MPNIRLKCVSDSGEQFEARGAVGGTIPDERIGNLSAAIIEEVPLIIEGLADGPIPTYTATILGLPSPPELMTSAVEADLNGEVRDQFDNLVDISYDPARWTWAIVNDTSGGASFGGPNNDDLTVGPNPGIVVISATHNETGASTQATIEVVATIVLTYVLEGLPAEVVELNDYPMTARVLNSDGSTNEAYNSANWTFSIDSGPGSITGANSDILSIPTGVAPATTVVRATHSGGFDTESVSVVAAAPAFPEILEPAGMSVVLAADGSSTNFGAGWQEELSWNDANKLAVVADVDSKFGDALEKRGFIGDSNWLGVRNRGNNVADHREIYARYVFRLSSNWQRTSQEAVFQYGRKLPGKAVDQFALILTQGTPGIRWDNGLTGADVGDESRNGVYEANTPSISALSLDEYHTLELLHRLNTNGNADGYLRVAVDGVEITSWNVLGGETNIDVRSDVEWASTGGDLRIPADSVH